MAKTLGNTLKFAAVAATIPLMVACGKKDETYTPVQPPAPKTLATSGVFNVNNIDDCGRKQLDNALDVAGKSKDDLTGTEYEAELAKTTAACRDAVQAALAQHKADRPLFDDKADCEKLAGPGQCEVLPRGQAAVGGTTTIIREHDSYSPMMTYFMMSHLFNNNNGGYSSGYSAGLAAASRNNVTNNYYERPQSTPVYRTPSNTYVTPDKKVFTQDSIRRADTSAFTRPTTPPAPVSKGETFSTKPYTPPAATLYTPPSRMPSAPAQRDASGGYKPSTSFGSSSGTSRTAPPSPPAARPSPAPAPSRSSGFSGGSSGGSRGFSGGGRSGGFGGGGGGGGR